MKADLTNDDYNKAKQIWKHFGMKNMGEYHDLYLKTDVLLLTDVYVVDELPLWWSDLGTSTCQLPSQLPQPLGGWSLHWFLTTCLVTFG